MVPVGILKCISAERNHVETGQLFLVQKLPDNWMSSTPVFTFNTAQDILPSICRGHILTPSPVGSLHVWYYWTLCFSYMYCNGLYRRWTWQIYKYPRDKPLSLTVREFLDRVKVSVRGTILSRTPCLPMHHLLLILITWFRVFWNVWGRITWLPASMILHCVLSHSTTVLNFGSLNGTWS